MSERPRPTTGFDTIRDLVLATDRIATAGQPTAEQFASIREAGYPIVVNLALPTSTGALPNERELADTAGIEYVHIPVDWQQPSAADVDAFFAVMDANRERRVFVHCALNNRASAFVYLYRRIRDRVSDREASEPMYRVWMPFDQWADLVDSTLARFGLTS
jgi:protein tyrosine phosphatase (PTP) superfamily phosphohydrolase (DUF442 family)